MKPKFITVNGGKVVNMNFVATVQKTFEGEGKDAKPIAYEFFNDDGKSLGYVDRDGVSQIDWSLAVKAVNLDD